VKLIVFLCLFLALFSCKPAEPKRSIQNRYSKELVNKYLEDTAEKYGFFCEGVKWGMYGGILRLIGPCFVTNEKLDIFKTRKLIVELTVELIDRVNDSEKLRPYLVQYPFTFQNIEMTIAYRREEVIENNELEFAYLKDGIIVVLPAKSSSFK